MSNEIFNRSSMTAIRRALRQSETAAGKRLWDVLRDRQVDGAKFRRQHSIGTYVVDFYCPASKLVIDLDGAVQDTPEAQRADQEREAISCSLGLSMLRFRNDDVDQRLDWVLEKIAENLHIDLPPILSSKN